GGTRQQQERSCRSCGPGAKDAEAGHDLPADEQEESETEEHEAAGLIAGRGGAHERLECEEQKQGGAADGGPETNAARASKTRVRVEHAQAVERNDQRPRARYEAGD